MIDVPAGHYELALGPLVVANPTVFVTVVGLNEHLSTIINGLSRGRVMSVHAGTVVIQNVVVQNGFFSATSSAGRGCGGGGLYVAAGATAVLFASSVEFNGIDATITIDANGQLQVTSAGSGGGVCTEGALYLTDSTVRNNGAIVGAGIRITSTGSATLLRSTVSNNWVTVAGVSGGGIDADGTLTMTGSTISGNGGPSMPGGGLSLHSGAKATIMNSTIANNGLSQINVDPGATATLGSTLIADGFIGNCAGAGAIISSGHNLERGNSCSLHDPTDLLFAHVVLGDLGNNGGLTQTHAVLAGSAGIDKGANPMGLDTDQRGPGFPRVVGAAIDIGAFESAADPPTVPQITNGPPGGGAVSVQYRFSYTTTGLPPPDFVVESGALPPGLSIFRNVLRGIPQVAGTFTGVMSAVNFSGSTSQPFSITIAPAPVLSSTSVIRAVEYHHALFDHYFMTVDPDEMAKLDSGLLAGWTRTGQGFNVIAVSSADNPGVCRFFSESFAPRSSHFYTPSASECATVRLNPKWLFEGIVFGIPVPNAQGTCPDVSLPVYRLYNDGQGGAPNHRYTTHFEVRGQMVTQGWVGEGYGALGVSMCSPY